MKKEITKGEVMSRLLSACPSYTERWNAYLQDYYEDGDEQLLYIDLADFATHVFELYMHNELDEFSALFNEIEVLHRDGDDFVQEAATIGLLESLQNRLLYGEINLNVFDQYLMPESLKWWNHLNDFWDGKTKYVGGPKH